MNAVHLVETRQAIDYKYGWVNSATFFWPQNAIAFSVLSSPSVFSQPRRIGVAHPSNPTSGSSPAHSSYSTPRARPTPSPRDAGAPAAWFPPAPPVNPTRDAFHNRVLDRWRRHRARVAVPFQLLLRPIAHVIAVPSLPLAEYVEYMPERSTSSKASRAAGIHLHAGAGAMRSALGAPGQDRRSADR